MSWPTVAAEVCSRYKPKGPPPGERSARKYFELLRQEKPEAAIDFLAHMLPARLAAWWGCLCLWDVSRPAPPPEVDAALQAVLRWVLEPAEPQRREAERAAVAVEDQPAGFLAQGVFFSGGSLIAPELPMVEPPPYLANSVIAGAVKLAASEGKKAAQDEQLRRFLEWGADVADGKNLWSHP